MARKRPTPPTPAVPAALAPPETVLAPPEAIGADVTKRRAFWAPLAMDALFTTDPDDNPTDQVLDAYLRQVLA